MSGSDSTPSTSSSPSAVSRRGFLATAAVAGAAAAVTVPADGAHAATTSAAAAAKRARRFGDLRDVKHVMVITQENRSFDHYFGTMKGVRGFGDRALLTFADGRTVFQQPTSRPGEPVTGTQFPWRLSDAPVEAYPADNRPPSSELGAQGYDGTSHGWADQHGAWNAGLMNGWVFSKGGLTTLGYMDRKDNPFHFALADAYTVGDAYHCSALSATGPNRTYLTSGTIDAQHKFGSFVAYRGGDELGEFLPWENYAETLQAAGVTWRVYQGSDDFGDNGLEYFASFAKLDPAQGGTPAPGNVFYDNGIATVPEPSTADTANADNLIAAIRADVLAGTFPQVSWVVSNETFSEHPTGAPRDGAYLVDGILRALDADPDVLNSTVVIINYDENDGQFDHVPPPVPAAGTTDEFFLETNGGLADFGVTTPQPIGLGFRVPLILVSPWTRGGWVTSEVSDHTSVLQFLERWTTALGTPAICPNISAWRRSVCGDLTAAFDFESPVYGLPELPATGPVIGNPPNGAYSPPVTTNAMPVQDPGTKKARPLPYQPNANLTGFGTGAAGSVQALLAFTNAGPHVRRAAHLSVYSNKGPVVTLLSDPSLLPGQYTVPASRSGASVMPGSVEIGAGRGDGAYDITVLGPNRFLRRFTGDVAVGRDLDVRVTYAGDPEEPVLVVELANNGSAPVTLTVRHEAYSTARPKAFRLGAHERARHVLDPLETSNGWYDLTVTAAGIDGWSRRYSGHLENGEPSVSG